MKKIIFLAHDPGGYDVILPVVQKLQQSVALNFYCVGPAARHDALYSASEAEVIQKLHSLLHTESLLGLVTGTSWGNDFELQMIAACKAAKVPTISILDYWTNYQTRFKNELGQLIYPDYYVVMDSIAAREAVQAGVPSGIIKVLGHPGLDQYVILPRKRSNLAEARKKILFLSQPLSNLYGSDLGYTEQQVIEDCLRMFCSHDNYIFHIKFHPKDNADFQQQYSNFAVQGNITELISAHDVIIGMNTMGLLHAVLMGIPSISYQPNLCKADMCITNKLGLTKLIHSYNELKALFDCDTIAQNNNNIYSQDNLIWVDGLSTERVAGFIREVLL
ncbi:hypothetical protein P22_0490 [Propionispora sp. 2/2-37]|uniref:hypothetical protein n=1 Tax=Propionispora sp. 2/2-37 TaxID=1677858 RepID=UPI0006BB9643|nr:hypothetical protein [Propionispora sp. 2/2-37]CUH94424.1 hypothetical protein P22_0490 [Propionispora sp. 2/2-37]